VAIQEQQPELLSSGAGLAAAVSVETHGELGESLEIKARGYWESVWFRLRKDKLALAGGGFIIFLFFVAFGGAPLAAHFLGHSPNDLFIGTGAIDARLHPKPGPWVHTIDPLTGKGTVLVLGADSSLGRDEFLRLLYGAQVSLEVAVGAMILGMTVGLMMGTTAGYFGGWIDTVISRITEITMAFPYLLFVIALASTVGSRIDDITLGFLGQGVITLVLVIGLFGWFYPARVFRATTLSLREKEFVEAARMVGASDWRIIRSHIVPHLVAPFIVFSTLIVATNVIVEAGLSFLGLGIKLPTASWGNLLSSATDFYLSVPSLMLWPGLALLLTTLSFNLLGDGLRDAFDPRSSR
jgi:peptide/nickel transport system permease protein